MTTTHVMPLRSEALRAPPPAPATRPSAKRWPLAWAALLLPGLARLGVAVASGAAVDAAPLFTWLAPGALVAAWVAWVHRRGAPRELVRVQKELRPLAPVAAAMSAVGVAAAVAPGMMVELAVPVVLSALAVFVFAEGEHGTLDQWLAQPLPRWRLFAEKAVLLVALAVGFLAQVAAVSPALELIRGYAPCLAAAVGLAPALALQLRGTVNALAVSTLFCLGELVFFGQAELSGEALPQGLVPLTSAALVVLPWAALLSRGSHAGLPDFVHRRWWSTAGRTAVGSLVRKEARLQLPVFGVLVPGLVLWLDAALQHRPDIATAIVGFFGVLSALLAGAIPVTSEHEYGTWSAEAALVPSRTAWRVKVGVSLAVALLVGVGVTALLVAATPGLLPVRQEVTVGGSWVDPDAQSLRRLLTTLAVWLGFTATAWSSGLLASTLTRRMTTSFLAALGLLGAAVVGFAMSLEPGMVMGWSLLGEPLRLLPGPQPEPGAASVAVRAALATVSLVLPPLAFFRLAVARRLGARLPAKAWAALALAVLAAGFCAGFALG